MVFIGMSDLDPDLLKRYAEGRCNYEEQLQVEAWLNDDCISEKSSIDGLDETRIAIWNGLKEKASAGKAKNTTIIMFSAIAAACVLLVTGLLFFKASVFKQDETYTGEMVRYTAPKARVVELKLPDQSTVTLSGGSTIEYPRAFLKDSRTVNFIKGEAFFAVQHDSQRPFLVSASGNQISVLGTRFNVNRTNPENLRVTLTQGAVSFKGLGHNETVLKPGQQLTCDLRKHSVEISTVDTAYITSWSSGILWFKNTPMQEVLRKLESYYGVTCSLQGSPDLQIPITARFEKQPLSKVLKLIQNSTPLRFKQEGNNVIIY